MALPRGRHNLSPDEVRADQRQRMLVAMAGALAERGYVRTTVSDVLEGARVSRRTFYEQFDDKETCFLAAYDAAERRAWIGAVTAVAEAPADDWPARVHAALGFVLEFAAAEPDAARLFTLEARAAGPEMGARHAAALDRIAAALQAGNGALDLPETTERTLVASVAALIGSYVLSGATKLLPGLEGQLGEHLLSPYREAAG